MSQRAIPQLFHAVMCDITACPQTLNFTVTALTNTRRKRRTAVKVIDDNCKFELKAALLREVNMYIEEHPSYQMLGRDFVRPSCVIEKICSEIRFFRSIGDLNIVLLHPKLKIHFLMLSVTLHLHPIKDTVRTCNFVFNRQEKIG